jgi:hypothetical protein
MSNTPYCKTCHKAGKSYNEYTNHWTRDKPGKDGNIICPVILNTVCNYCKEKGHWIKFCPGLSSKTVETEPYIQPLNSWANILKCKQKQPNLALQNSHYYNDLNIDVSVCDVAEMSRPTSPLYPPPNDYSRPPSPDYPPPTDYS